MRRPRAPLLALCWLASYLALGAAPALAQQVEIAGKHVTVYAPAREGPAAQRIAEQGDRALARYAADLGFALPPARFKLFLYATEAEYVRAEEPRTRGRFRYNLAFTYAQDAEVHMVFQPRLGRPATGDAPGMLEALAMHELSHALQYKLIPSYDFQPDWLSEGLAELHAERAVAGADQGCADRSPWFAGFLHDVRAALDQGSFVPLDRLVDEGIDNEKSRKDPVDRRVRYGEAWSLVRLLDSPGDLERRKKFRSYLRDVMALPAGPDVGRRANERLREVFGGRGGALAPLERELVASVREAKAFPWQIVFRDLRALPDGSLAVESFPQNSAMSIYRGEDLPPGARIRATATIADLGARQADLIFAFRSTTDYWKLAFGSAGYVTLLRFDGGWTTVANANVAPELLAPGAPHVLEAIVDVGRLFGRVDGKVVFKYTLQDRNFGSGRWGIGTYDGRVAFRSAEGAPLE